MKLEIKFPRIKKNLFKAPFVKPEERYFRQRYKSTKSVLLKFWKKAKEFKEPIDLVKLSSFLREQPIRIEIHKRGMVKDINYLNFAYFVSLIVMKSIITPEEIEKKIKNLIKHYVWINDFVNLETEPEIFLAVYLLPLSSPIKLEPNFKRALLEQSFATILDQIREQMQNIRKANDNEESVFLHTLKSLNLMDVGKSYRLLAFLEPRIRQINASDKLRYVLNPPGDGKLEDKLSIAYKILNGKVPEVLDVFRVNVFKYVKVKNIEGQSLFNLYSNGVSKKFISKVLEEYGELVGELARHHYIYLDIAMRNVIIDKRGNVNLIDFERFVKGDVKKYWEKIERRIKRELESFSKYFMRGFVRTSKL